jgi:predicted transcriptional regulator YheO
MAADTELEVYNFEGNLEKGFSDFLNSLGVTLHNSNDPQTLPENSNSVQVSIGKATGHALFKGANKDYGQYDFSVDFFVRTENGSDEKSNDANIKRKHQEIVSLVRMHFAVDNAKGILDPFVPLYQIDTLIPNGTVRSVGDGTDILESTISYVGQFTILSTAFPA